MPEREDPRPDVLSTDPGALARALELELIVKRAAWEKARTRRGRWRVLSLLFLLLVIGGAIVAYFLVAAQMNERRASAPSDPAEAAAGR